MKIMNIPEEISTDNIEDTIMAQNTETGIGKGEIIPEFIYDTKRHTRNIVIEVNSQTRKKLIDIKVKISRIDCNIEDYLVAVRFFKCSRFNHRTSNCKGTVTCPLCTENHNLKECKARPDDYKCINCICMYVCMYICVYICVYVCVYVNMYVCMYVCIYVCMF